MDGRNGETITGGFPRGYLGAGDEIRTRDQELGKLLLYQLSYARPVVGGGIVPQAIYTRHGGRMYSLNRRMKEPEGPVR
jgi:hypothetical protein